MSGYIVQGTNSSTTRDWQKAAERMELTAYAPSLVIQVEPEVIEPGQAVNLSAADRARMNRFKPGVQPRPEQL